MGMPSRRLTCQVGVLANRASTRGASPSGWWARLTRVATSAADDTASTDRDLVDRVSEQRGRGRTGRDPGPRAVRRRRRTRARCRPAPDRGPTSADVSAIELLVSEVAHRHDQILIGDHVVDKTGATRGRASRADAPRRRQLDRCAPLVRARRCRGHATRLAPQSCGEMGTGGVGGAHERPLAVGQRWALDQQTTGQSQDRRRRSPSDGCRLPPRHVAGPSGDEPADRTGCPGAAASSEGDASPSSSCRRSAAARSP